MGSKVSNLEDLYIDLLKDVYSAETQLVKALPKMSKAAQSSKLRRGFDAHLRQTQGQVKRLDKIFAELDRGPRGKKCVGMEGLIKEADEVIKEDIDASVVDAALIAAAQKVEHYEISAYGTARTYATALGYEGAANLLQQSLNEEFETNILLTKMAEDGINQEAMASQSK